MEWETNLYESPEEAEGASSDKENVEDEKALIEKLFENDKEAFERVLERMRPDILAGRWSSVIGDDISGRIPALVIKNLLERVSKERGATAPSGFFYAGGEGIEKRRENLREYIKRIRPGLGQRTLIVTEYVLKGRSVKTLAELLNEYGIAFDVVTLYGYSDAEPESEDQRKLDLYSEARQEAKRADIARRLGLDKENRLYDGYLFEYVPDYRGYELRNYTGVEKDIERQSAISKKVPINQELLRFTRQKARELGDELYKKLSSSQ